MHSFKTFFSFLVAVWAHLILTMPAHAQLDNGAAFAPDGKSIIFHSYRDGSGEIVELDLTSGTRRRITPGGQHDRWPSLNRSSDQIVFISQRNPPWKVYKVNRDGTGLMLLTQEEGMHLGASWSPDGGKIVYARQNLAREGFSVDLWIMNADGSGKKKLLDNAMWPKWHKDTGKIYFATAADNGQVGLAVYDPETASKTVLTDFTTNVTGSGVSPDGAHIYVSVQMEGHHFLHRMKPDGSEMENLNIASQIDSSPVVSPDGRYLAYGYNDGGGTDLWLLELSTGVTANLSEE